MKNNLSSASVAIDALIADFQALPSWENRYRHLIELGNELPRLAASDENDALYFRGCQSCVWLRAALDAPCDADARPRLRFWADSDSKINRGLIAVLHRVYSGQPTDFVLEYDINALFAELDLEQHLNAGRRNGLYDMEMHLKTVARTAVYTA